MRPRTSSILIADDQPEVIYALETLLHPHFNEVRSTTRPKQVHQMLQKEQPDVLLMDMNYSQGRNSGEEGLTLIRQIKQDYPSLPVVVMTAFGDTALAVESVKRGAEDFVNKPWSNQSLVQTLQSAMKAAPTVPKDSRTVSTLVEHRMIGESSAMKRVRDQILKIAPTEANVLILGENGTGKELVAEAIHQASSRSTRVFEKIDMGVVHGPLFETELFGAKKGAYTGLNQDKMGRFHLANSGTLFLDEMGNLPLELQSKLLSVLQNRSYTPVGDVVQKKLDIRLLSATNISMDRLMDPKYFRQDLLYRINTVEIEIPPLRERREDIPLLMDHFMKRHSTQSGRDHYLSQDAVDQAVNYHWPGNVRELEHAMERALVMAEGDKIGALDLFKKKYPVKSGSNQSLAEMEKSALQASLIKHRGSVTKVALELGLSRAAVYRRMEKYDL